MIDTGYELIWLFFVYSFAGWILETIAAAVKQKRFVNRGLVDLPFCILYGIAAVGISIFGRELQGFWLYFGSVILILAIEWLAGHLIEAIYHEKWWDYSNSKWNIEGYVSIPVVACLGVLAVIMMKWGNSLFLNLFRMMPKIVGVVLIWLLIILLTMDVAATLLVIHGKGHRAKKWKNVERCFEKISHMLANRIYTHIENRIKRAYPDARKVDDVKKTDTVFAYGCSFYKLVWLFLIGAFLGDITETIFCRITTGVWMSRSSVVWGPFSIVWGLAIAIATILLHKYKDRQDRVIFFAGLLLGGAYEYICSVFTEMVFGKVFWDYSEIPFNLGGRINLLYCFFWGIAAVIWIKYIYPSISAWIEKIPVKAGKILSWGLIFFMCCNMAVSSLALIRSEQRAMGVPAQEAWQQLMDERFDDERLERIYPNALNAN